MNSIERDIRDYTIEESCEECCMSCKKYKTVKEQNKNCEVRKARGRIINRMIYKAKKDK